MILSMMSNNAVKHGWESLPMARSSVRFLVSGSGTMTSEFLWLASSGVGNQETLVVREEELLHLSLGGLIVVFLGVGDDSLGDSHSHGHALVHGTSTADSNSDGEVLELGGTQNEKWLVNLGHHGLWLNEVEWLSVHSNESSTLLAQGNGGCVLLLSKSSHLLLLVTHYFLDMMHKLRLY